MTNDLSLCESPIEAALGAELVRFLDVEPQYEVTLGGTCYRIDFAILVGGEVPYRIAVECDGHDYHERTPEQAARDRSRDRAFVAAGWRVLRFTGSEIHANPRRCAEQVVELLIKDGIREGMQRRADGR